MLHHNSNIPFWLIFSHSIQHNDTCIKASKVCNLNEAHKWLFLFWRSPFTNWNTWRNDKHIFAKDSWDVANLLLPPIKCYASKFLQTQATWLYLHRFHALPVQFYDQSLWPLKWHSYTDFFITWIILRTDKFWCIGNIYIMKLFIQAIHNYLHIHSSHHLALFV